MKQNLENLHSFSLFQEAWWLDIVAPGQWDEVVLEEKNKIIARWPYIKKKKYIFNVVSLPQLTQHLGPWISESNGSYCNQLSYQHKILNSLIEMLPSYDIFLQSFHPAITNGLPFYWAGFFQSTRYTYLINGIKDHESIWRNLRENIRCDIRKAQKRVQVRTDLGMDVLYDLCKKTYARQNKKIPFSFEFLKRLDDMCSSRNSGKAFFAQDDDGNVHAGIYVVYDQRSAHYLIGGADPQMRTSGAHSLLLWESILYMSQFVDLFDFEGSMVKSIERFFRAFGGVQVPYFRISNTSKSLRMFKSLI